MANGLGDIKSTAGTINHLIKAIENGILGTNEELSKSPSSFINILLDQIGSINSANFYEMLALKNETTKSTAKLRRSLIRYLDSDEFIGIMGKPSTFTFNLGFKIDDLINNGVVDGLVKKLTINRNSIITLVDNPIFSFDNDIDIFIRDIGNNSDDIYERYRIFAKYRPITGSVHSTISNPFIKSFIQTVDGEKYFIMILNLKQYERSYNEFNALNSSLNKYEFSVRYLDNLYAFEVLYKAPNSETYSILKGQPDGIINKTGYNFSLSNRSSGFKSLDIKFNRNPSYFSPENGSSIRIVTYTTKGINGNFTINGWDDDEPPIRDVIFDQDVDDPFQEPINTIPPLVSIVDSSSVGGSDELDIDSLRDFVIRKSNSKLMTIVELEEVVKNYGMRLTKERFDVLDIYYRLSGSVKHENLIFDTTSGLVELNLDKLQKSDTTGTLIFSPKTKMKVDNNRFKLLNSDETSIIDNYIDTFNDKSFNIHDREFFFPFFMRIDLSSYIDAKVYDMAIDDTRPLIFEYYNEGSTSEAGVDSCSIKRDPINDDEIVYYEDGTSKYIGKYKISFDIQINELIYNRIDSAEAENPIRIYMKLTGANGSFIIDNSIVNNRISITKINDSNNVIRVETSIYTDCGIDEYDRIAIIDDSVVEFPRKTSPSYSTYLIDKIVNLSVNICFEGTPSDKIKYDNIIHPDDRSGFQGVSAVYTLEDINLLKNITNTIKPIVDVKASRKIMRYTENIPELYSETVFERDGDGEIIYDTVTLPDNTTQQVPRILHFKDEPKLDSNGDPIYLHKIGDPVLDGSGNPIYDESDPNEVKFEVRDFPLVDRIYSEFENYWNTIKGFKSLVERIESFQNLSPTGTSGKLGVLNTLGSGKYYFVNRKTGAENSIDRLALSFRIGLKTDGSEIDEDLLVSSVKREILSYIQQNSTSPSVSFMEMLDVVKENVDGIKYFELYNVNDYDEGICHSIYTKEEEQNDNFDIITLKNIVNVNDTNVDFTQDIEIIII